MDLDHSIGAQFSDSPPVTTDVPMTDMPSGSMGHSQLTTTDQSEPSSQLGLSLGGGTILPPAQSPKDRLSTTSRNGIEDFWRQLPSQKTVVVEAGKKQKAPKTRKKKDANEPQKPSLVIHRLPSRDRIPMPLLGEVSKIVASMWDSLGEEQKQVYKRETEAAKKEHLKALRAYKDTQECQATVETVELDTVPPSQTPSPPPMATVDPAFPASASTEHPALSCPIVVNSTLSSYVANQEEWSLLARHSGDLPGDPTKPNQYNHSPAQSTSPNCHSLSVAAAAASTLTTIPLHCNRCVSHPLSSKSPFRSSLPHFRPSHSLHLRKFEPMYSSSHLLCR
ncbi:hypothetical protein GH733_009961 [Mirounga leonina]|nr:hypothetical protein GH733_009961 [Mirounga leonina]